MGFYVIKSLSNFAWLFSYFFKLYLTNGPIFLAFRSTTAFFVPILFKI